MKQKLINISQIQGGHTVLPVFFKEAIATMEKSIKKYWPIFVLPTFAAFIIGFIVPFIEGIYLSFCKFTTIRDASFVGLSNYVEALALQQFLLL